MKYVDVFVSHPFAPEIRYTLRLMEDVLNCEFRFTDRCAEDCLVITDDMNTNVLVGKEGFKHLREGKTQWQNFFTDAKPILVDGRPDYIFSIFYIVNSFQEYGQTSVDKYGRVKSEDSWQYKHGILSKSVVSEWIKLFAKDYLSRLGVTHLEFKTRIFLSHDVDTLYGAFLQDSYYCFKKQLVKDFLAVCINAILNRPSWFNIDRIMRMESVYDFNSTFFWIVTKQKGRYDLSNADYNVSSKKLTAALSKVSASGCTNGLHKSTANFTFDEELKMLPQQVTANRYHYLLFQLPDGYADVADSGIKFDSSLGYADRIGFRNCYSMPFMPFDVERRMPYGFLECPLHVMDTTYHFYNRLGADKLVEDSILFIESNNTNSFISVLFHNNYLSDYKFGEYLGAFKKLLFYFYESGFRSVSPEEMTKSFLREY